MLHNLILFLPLIFVIVFSLKTQQMAESLIIGTLLSMLILYKQDFLTGTIHSFYTMMSNSSFQFAAMVILSFGAFVKLLQESGSLMGFYKWIVKVAKGPKSAMLIAWLLSIVLFVDDYLNAMTTPFIIHTITDKNKIPREHLVLQTHSMTCSLCILVPFTSWTGFTLGIISKNGLGFQDYVHAIPYMLFPWGMVFLTLLLIFHLFPRMGLLRQAYDRVKQGGDVLYQEGQPDNRVEFGDLDRNNVSSAWNAVIPILSIIVGLILFEDDLLHGLFLALIMQFVLYTVQKRMSFKRYFDLFFEGIQTMIPMVVIMAFGFVLCDANEQLGLFDLIIGSVGQSLPSSLLPAIVFLLTGFCAFAVGSCWVVMMLAIPIFLALASAIGANVILSLAAIMSGIVMGPLFCFYSDIVFMSSAGTGVSNLNIVKTLFPYTVIMTIVSSIGYLILGFMM